MSLTERWQVIQSFPCPWLWGGSFQLPARPWCSTVRVSVCSLVLRSMTSQMAEDGEISIFVAEEGMGTGVPWSDCVPV